MILAMRLRPVHKVAEEYVKALAIGYRISYVLIVGKLLTKNKTTCRKVCKSRQFILLVSSVINRI